MSRFDWYQATVVAAPGAIQSALEGAADGCPKWEEMAKAPHGYGAGRKLSDMFGQVAMVWWGGCHDHPHVVSSGESAQVVSDVLRGGFEHRVTRADACIDFAEAGAYDRLEGIALGVADQQGVTVGTAGDHLLRQVGRTVYLGATTSHTRLRIYEKGDELRAKYRNDPKRLAEVPRDLTRLECQVRPQTLAARTAAATAAPLEIMGSTKWMRELMLRVGGTELEPFQAGKPWRQSDDDRAYAALLSQYGGLLARLKNDHGTWDMLGRQIGDDLAFRALTKGR